MRIGVLKETKANERRVGLTPGGARQLVRCGHEVLFEPGAGIGAGFSDASYMEAGAVAAAQKDIYAHAEMVIHVREPQPEEYSLFRRGQIVFAYLHLDTERSLAEALLASGATGISCDSMLTPDGGRPMVAPMSEIFGRLGMLEAARLLQTHNGGKGKLLGGVPGVDPGLAVIVGGGLVGLAAARTAAGLGGRVILLEKNPERIKALTALIPSGCVVLNAGNYDLQGFLPRADIIIGAAGGAGRPAPRVLARSDLQTLEPGSVLVDIAIDKGGCFESSRKTSHENPTYVEEGIVHYCVPNIPAAMPHTATLALTGVSIRYLEEIAQNGLDHAIRTYPELSSGCCIACERVTNPVVAGLLGLPCIQPESLFSA